MLCTFYYSNGNWHLFQVVASPSTCQGYSYPVDWWSLGVTAFELKAGGQRPFEINPKTSVSSAIVIFEASKNSVPWPSTWSPEFAKFVASLLTLHPDKRISTLALTKKAKLMANLKFNHLMNKKSPPPFIPSKDGLNCDPTYELEEMIVEAKPLHKKKKRLLRQQSLLSNSPSSNNSLHGSDVSGTMPNGHGRRIFKVRYTKKVLRYSGRSRSISPPPWMASSDPFQLTAANGNATKIC